ncbi:MAG: electron transfer flavoprotein subunit alpha/FixB family protein, partial [Bacteroidota bacterium]
FIAVVRTTLPAVVSIRSGSYAAAPVDEVNRPEVNRLDYSLDGRPRAQLLGMTERLGGRVDLTDARVVVAAGRGVRNIDGKRLVEELADVFDAAIGSSRAVVENGLFESTTQIGQTGKVVSPDLYFALGISGAIQHVAGMQNSRVVVAINKDPSAPIFDYATYGIVGDLFEVLPPLIDTLREAKEH